MSEIAGIGTNCEQRGVQHKDTPAELHWHSDMAHPHASWKKAHSERLHEKVEVNGQNIHTVKYGETLDDLAMRWRREHGQSTNGSAIEAQKRELIALNRDALPDLARQPDLLQPGWKLRMAPCPEPEAAKPVAPVGEPVRPVKEPVAPVGEPVRPVKEPVAPVGKPVAPVGIGAGQEPIAVQPGTGAAPYQPQNPAPPYYGQHYRQASAECSQNVPWKSALIEAGEYGAAGAAIGAVLGFRGRALGAGLGFLAGGIVGFAKAELESRFNCIEQKMDGFDKQIKPTK